MSEKLFSQGEVNRIVASRVSRERERLTKEFESKMRRCMASVHLMLHQEMCSLKWELVVEPKDTEMSGCGANDPVFNPKCDRRNPGKQKAGD